MQHFMKPHRRLILNVGMLPRLPWIIRLRLAGDESPIDCSDAFLPGDGPDRVERAAHRARHVFRANHWPMKSSQPCDLGSESLGPPICVKRNAVRLGPRTALSVSY